MRKTLFAPALAAGVLAAVPGGSAFAATMPAALPPVLDTLSAPAPGAKACTTDLSPALAGGAKTSYVAPMSGYVSVRGAAPDSSDWDLAVFDAATGKRLGASQSFGSHEVGQSFPTAGQRLTIEGCRRAGDAGSFAVSTTLVDVAPPAYEGKTQLVEVTVGSQGDLARIENAGLDLTH